jgi:hypothetical protein
MLLEERGGFVWEFDGTLMAFEGFGCFQVDFEKFARS